MLTYMNIKMWTYSKFEMFNNFFEVWDGNLYNVCDVN